MWEAINYIFTMGSVAKHVPPVSSVTHVPMASVKSMRLHISTLSFAENAKFGQLGRWPAMHQFKAHFPSFLDNGYEGHREALEVKFEMSTVEPDKGLYHIKPFSVGYIDGQNKGIIMLSILALIADLDSWLPMFTSQTFLRPLESNSKFM